jgi:uncharacterized membrane protein YozB (DUF420 family)
MAMNDRLLFRPSFLWRIVIIALAGIIAIVAFIWLTNGMSQSSPVSLDLEKRTDLPIARLPTLNAILNATSALLLGMGYFFIRRRNIAAHKVCMLSAVAVSALFLLSYLTYHYFAGSTPFAGQGWVRLFYFVVLIPHTILAVILIPLVIVVVRRGLQRRDGKHRWLAQRVLPIWFYTSVTGIVVYVMLYHLF